MKKKNTVLVRTILRTRTTTVLLCARYYGIRAALCLSVALIVACCSPPHASPVLYRRTSRMGAGASFDRPELAALSVSEVAHLVSTIDITGLSQYRQACIDFGIDGDMLTRLPRDQLADALRRAGVGNGDHLEYLLGELENVRRTKE